MSLRNQPIATKLTIISGGTPELPNGTVLRAPMLGEFTPPSIEREVITRGGVGRGAPRPTFGEPSCSDTVFQMHAQFEPFTEEGMTVDLEGEDPGYNPDDPDSPGGYVYDMRCRIRSVVHSAWSTSYGDRPSTVTATTLRRVKRAKGSSGPPTSNWDNTGDALVYERNGVDQLARIE